MIIADMYQETLKSFSGWVSVSQWAVRFGEMFLEELEDCGGNSQSFIEG